MIKYYRQSYMNVPLLACRGVVFVHDILHTSVTCLQRHAKYTDRMTRELANSMINFSKHEDILFVLRCNLIIFYENANYKSTHYNGFKNYQRNKLKSFFFPQWPYFRVVDKKISALKKLKSMYRSLLLPFFFLHRKKKKKKKKKLLYLATRKRSKNFQVIRFTDIKVLLWTLRAHQFRVLH